MDKIIGNEEISKGRSEEVRGCIWKKVNRDGEKFIPNEDFIKPFRASHEDDDMLEMACLFAESTSFEEKLLILLNWPAPSNILKCNEISFQI